MTTFLIFRHLPPIPLGSGEFAANFEYADECQAKSADLAIRWGKALGILHPVVQVKA